MLNRADARRRIFENEADDAAFEEVLVEAVSFPVQEDEYFYTLRRYVERNAWRAHLVRRADTWRWGSLQRWKHGPAKAKAVLAAWPLPRWPGWVERVNAAQSDAELAAVRRSVQRGNPFG